MIAENVNICIRKDNVRIVFLYRNVYNKRAVKITCKYSKNCIDTIFAA